jgi:deoxycytidine triphosphate deaminase
MKHIMGPQSRSTLTNVKEGDVQPNAVDLRLGKVFKMSQSTFKIDEREKVHRGSFEMKPDGLGYFNLPEGHYEVIMENMITVGEGEAGWVITRSTLNRNGVFLTSGLYDTGYDGVMAGVMHVSCGPMRIQVGTRIGQYISFNAEALHKYDGSYGKNKEHDLKYQIEAFNQQNALKELGIEVDPALEVEQPPEPVKRGRGRPFGTTKDKINPRKEA